MTDSPSAEKIQAFISRLPDTYEPADPNEAQVVFESPLQLTREQEDSLVTHAMQRMETMESNLGRNDLKESTWYRSGVEQTKQAARTFFGKRQLFENVYHLQMDWREYAYGEDSIFAESNLTLPISRRIVQQQAARANGYFFGSDPWFSTSPVGNNDRDLSDEVERFCRYKLRKGKAKATLKQANRGPFIRGESVVKTTYRTDVSYYKSFKNVAIDPETSEPIVAADGDYIYDDSQWIRIDPESNGLNADGQMMRAKMVLKRDMRTVQRPNMEFETRLVRRQLTKYRGAIADEIYFKDFLCPEDATNVQDADTICHLYDRPAVEFAQMYMERVKEMGDYGNELPRVIDFLNTASPRGSLEPVALSTQPREQLGDEGDDQSRSNVERSEPTIRTAEFYLWFDADEDGYMENIMMVVDVDSKTPIYYDYVENITPDGKRPFHVFRINPVENRWYGVGSMELLWPLQEALDLMWNRMNFSQSRAGNVYFWNPHNVQEGEHEENLEFNGGETYTLNYGKEAKDALEVVPIYDVKFDKLDRMIELITQFAVNLSGVANANDAGMAGLDTQERATGIVNIEKSGQELFGDFINDLEDGNESAVLALVMLELAFMESQEMYEFFDGQDRQIAHLDRGRVADIEIDVKIDLDRYQGERMLEKMGQAINTGVQFYELLPEIQERLTPLFQDVLKKLGVKNVDRLISPMIGLIGSDPEAMAAAGLDPNALVQPPAARADSESLANAGEPTDSEAELNLPPNYD